MKNYLLFGLLLLIITVKTAHGQRLISLNEIDKYTHTHNVSSKLCDLKSSFWGGNTKVSIRRVDSSYALFFVIRKIIAFTIFEGDRLEILLENGDVITTRSGTNSISHYLYYGKVWIADAGYEISSDDMDKLTHYKVTNMRLAIRDHDYMEIQIPKRKAQTFMEFAVAVKEAERPRLKPRRHT